MLEPRPGLIPSVFCDVANFVGNRYAKQLSSLGRDKDVIPYCDAVELPGCVVTELDKIGSCPGEAKHQLRSFCIISRYPSPGSINGLRQGLRGNDGKRLLVKRRCLACFIGQTSDADILCRNGGLRQPGARRYADI